ncbi:MAG: MGMT family protein [Verrucomicrobiota bacterium]|nr:MGMT family protein [Verrucomicrobiota bacterium]
MGEFYAEYTQNGLCRLCFPRVKKNIKGDSLTKQQQSWHRKTQRAVKAILTGRVPLALPPLDFPTETVFRRHVWNMILTIPVGTVWTYGKLAWSINQPNATRAVGGACGANPIPVLIPCHRVIGASGKLAGFSAGINWKIRLLRIEGVELPLH